MNEVIEMLGGRKFIFGMTVLVMAFLLTIFGKDSLVFLATAGTIYATYVAGNVTQKSLTAEIDGYEQ